MGEVSKGDLVVTGRDGIRVTPLVRPQERDVFSFMEAQVSSERPHAHILADVARRMQALREGTGAARGGKVLLAAGPAVIHAGGRDALTWLVESGFIHVLFCGNALAAHDMEAHLFGAPSPHHQSDPSDRQYRKGSASRGHYWGHHGGLRAAERAGRDGGDDSR